MPLFLYIRVRKRKVFHRFLQSNNHDSVSLFDTETLPDIGSGSPESAAVRVSRDVLIFVGGGRDVSHYATLTLESLIHGTRQLVWTAFSQHISIEDYISNGGKFG